MFSFHSVRFVLIVSLPGAIMARHTDSSSFYSNARMTLSGYNRSSLHHKPLEIVTARVKHNPITFFCRSRKAPEWKLNDYRWSDRTGPLLARVTADFRPKLWILPSNSRRYSEKGHTSKVSGYQDTLAQLPKMKKKPKEKQWQMSHWYGAFSVCLHSRLLRSLKK